jgi:hypothetical protein
MSRLTVASPTGWLAAFCDVEDVIQHPERLTRLEMAEPDFHLSACFPDHLWKEFFGNEALVLREEEFGDRRSQRLLPLSSPTSSNAARLT